MKVVTRKMNGMKLPQSEKVKMIGEEMSRKDPYYIPSQKSINPFLPLFGNTKIMGNLFWSCIEFNNLNIQPVYRKTVSMIDKEPPNLKKLDEN